VENSERESATQTRGLPLWSQLPRLGVDPKAWASLWRLAGFVALTAAGAATLLASYDSGGPLEPLALVGGGAAAGCGLAAWQRHPVRRRGLAPFGTLALVAAFLWCALFLPSEPPGVATGAILLGFGGALTAVPLCCEFSAATRADTRGKGVVVAGAVCAAAVVTSALLLHALAHGGILPTPFWQFAFLAVLALIGTVVAVRRHFRAMVENIVECLVWPVYRIRAHGPGKDKMPLRGPMLVVSNHTSYADIFFLGKVTPRSLVPMMTSLFYDLPFIRWWMVHVVHTIRVEAATFRREAPELREAAERLRRGECLVIFPEARLRTREDALLRPFGQGVWHILREAPETVVTPVWIEGGWGSWASYYKGPPMKNKRFDFWRRIDVCIGEPAPLPPDVLQDQRRTREYLREACFACRAYIGLPATGGGLTAS
jgi:1-acyl-sn-glycerol-3-phosphate acyltransferase